MKLNTTVVVNDPLGFHLRAAAQFITMLKHYKCNVWVQKGSDLVDARSIVCLLQLAAIFGTELNVILDGTDASEALSGVLNFFSQRNRFL
jgi:phosphotransferase system HPr (HPr) family protein